jgi:ACS family glucarate transporter-like MFS transporter
MPTRIVVMLFGMVVISYFDRTVLSIAAPTVMKEFGFSEQQMGWIMSAFLWSYALMMVPGGRLSDRIGTRRSLTACLGGSGLFTALAAFGSGFATLFTARVGFGIAQAPLFPAVNKTNANWSHPDQRARVQGLVASGAGLGSAMSPFAVTALIAWSGWQAAFILAGVLSIVASAVWWKSASEAPPNRYARAQPAPWRTLFSNRNLMLLTIGFTALDYYEYIFFYWIFYYFGEIRKMSAGDTAFYSTVFFLTWLVMTPIGGWTADRLSAKWGRKAGLRAAAMGFLISSAVVMVIGTGAEDGKTAAILMSLAFGLCSCSDVNFWASTIEVMGDQAGAAGGIMNAGGNFGGALAPVCTTIIAASYGWTWGLYFGCAIAMIGVAVWLFIDTEPNDHSSTTLH